MPLDPHAQRFIRAMMAASARDMPRIDAIGRRSNFAKLMSLSDGHATAACIEECTIPGPSNPIRVRIYTPASAHGGRLPGLVYFHGGGFVAGSLDTHDALCRELANEIGCRLVSVDYRLAPEHKYPAALEDGYAATAWVVENAAKLEIEPDVIGVGGDSAGGTLAAAVCQMARQAGVRLAYQLLFCPIMDFTAETGSRLAFLDDPLINKAILDRDLELCLPKNLSAAHPQISPLRAADLSGLPPAYIHTAEFDPLRDEGRLYADRLEALGTEVHYTCHPGMIHMFYALGRVIPYSRLAAKLVGAELRERTSSPHLRQ